MSNVSKEDAWGCLENMSLDPQHLFKEEFMSADFAMSLSCMDWVYVFQSMHQIAVKNTEEYLRLEAISVMNVVLMRSNAFTEREKFGGAVVFEGIAQLLKKDASSHVQKKTLQMLYLLLNCPKLLGIFCSGCKVGEGDDAVNDERNSSSFKEFSFILDGLANCLSCCGNSFQDIEIRKKAVNFLAFLASSGKSGFEILVGHNLTGAPNFIVLMLHVLVSEIDAEVSVPVEPAEKVKARLSTD
uniref:Uncharacterized protein LOC8278527 n=1 Tax=Rhizophora mucronata TaxID=61149 RepID=A0A2P2KA97_RHIMU